MAGRPQLWPLQLGGCATLSCLLSMTLCIVVAWCGAVCAAVLDKAAPVYNAVKSYVANAATIPMRAASGHGLSGSLPVFSATPSEPGTGTNASDS